MELFPTGNEPSKQTRQQIMDVNMLVMTIEKKAFGSSPVHLLSKKI
jgi:hypothetical protein